MQRVCQTSSQSGYPIFAHVLKSCAAALHFNFGRVLHSVVIKQGRSSCLLILKSLLNMYAKCELLDDCRKLFDEIDGRDTVTWNIILSGFAGTRNHDVKVMGLFSLLRCSQDPKPSPVTLAIVLPVFTRLGCLGSGKSIHAYAVKSGMESQTLVGNALVSTYAKCGVVLDASAVFYGIADKDVVSYNAIIAGFAENKLVDKAFELFVKMIEELVIPNYATIANMLPVCAALESTFGVKKGKEIHSYVLRRTELEEETTVTNALLSFYLRNGKMSEAQSIFRKMKSRDLVSWNSMIAGYAANGEWIKALKIFHEFVRLGCILDSVTLISILPACTELCCIQVGKEIHAYAIRHLSFCEDTSVGNALIRFYAKCGYIENAIQTFLLIPQKDLISWNTLLDAFGENLLESRFAEFLYWMHGDEVKPDAVTVLIIVKFYAILSKISNIKQAHGYSLRSGVLLAQVEPTLGNTMIDAYAKCGNMEYASKLFENFSDKRNVVTCNSMISGYLANGSYDDANMLFRKMSQRDLTSWNLLVRGYAVNECPSEALNLFHELHCHHIKPDSMTMVSILLVCGQMASIHLLRQCHGHVVRACSDDVHLKAALLDVYSKCGSLNSAHKLYMSTSQKDLVIFTAMIGAYAMHGMGDKAIEVFGHMLRCNVKPDHVVMTAVLSACCHAGLINEGLIIFNSIDKLHHMTPGMEQYACMVDLLARGGRIEEAFSFLNQMPVAANADMWGTLLHSCKTHHNVDMGHVVADHILKDETTDIGNFVILSNLFAEDAKWEGVVEMRKLMKMRYLKKPAGCSWIEVGRFNLLEIDTSSRTGGHVSPEKPTNTYPEKPIIKQVYITRNFKTDGTILTGPSGDREELNPREVEVRNKGSGNG
ncbi:pentatricopeptide repeat-containing protein [Dorcoceras hygrometricum]|uniref:Pentatricopeptide repeat-containing protein n=1 Tax=Dorcoceras hygrometricum TaxID=472368 RepID=A0A2Z7A9X4_9LAMI|nr:pentatricopeptide repeat-containing protein [Dorcoceras hygrometricum]